MYFFLCRAIPLLTTLHFTTMCLCASWIVHLERKGPDESDRFMMDPPGFATAFAKNWSMPSHIVLFDSEEPSLKDFLVYHSFVEVKRLFHAHFKVDRDLQASVVVYASRSCDWIHAFFFVVRSLDSSFAHAVVVTTCHCFATTCLSFAGFHGLVVRSSQFGFTDEE
ncbi:hypothetical protein Dimus_005130 [Dionaea muscipula]